MTMKSLSFRDSVSSMAIRPASTPLFPMISSISPQKPWSRSSSAETLTLIRVIREQGYPVCRPEAVEQADICMQAENMIYPERGFFWLKII